MRTLGLPMSGRFGIVSTVTWALRTRDATSSLPILFGAVWSYSVVAVGFWLFLRLGGDRWWLATLFLFGPRWLCLIPLVVLALIAAVRHARALWVLGATGLFLVFPVLGFRIPWAACVAGERAAIATRAFSQCG